MKKKLLLVSFLSLIIFGMVSINQQKAYAYAYSVDENLKEEKIEISKNEQEFFNKKIAEQEILNTKSDIVIVDTINNRNKETILVKGVEYEKDALIYSVYRASLNVELETYITENSKSIDDTTKSIIQSFQYKAISEDLSYNDIAIQFDDSKSSSLDISFAIDMLPKEVIIDSSSVQTKATYYYEIVYVGYYETYNYLWTDTGIYSIQAEYYMDGQVKVYTGSTRYVLNAHFCSYDHKDVIEFDYQTYNVLGNDYGSPPVANIHLINDFWGEQKMILDSDDIGVAYKISQDSHYSRNQYNKIGNYPLDEIFPTEASLDNNFGLALSEGKSYFHQILSSNSDNSKYTDEITYYDTNLGVTLNGSYELVYDANGNVEYEDLVTFTFNFGVDESDPENEALDDAHYIRDVYPYLVWGNTETDYDNHTAFERFVWDKDSAENYITLNYEGKNLSGDFLIIKYLSGEIGDFNGTSIPVVIQDNAARWDIFFDYIPDQYIQVNQYTSYDWTTMILGKYSENPGIIVKFEEWEIIDYSLEGDYAVRVGIEDSTGLRRYQTINVHISGC
jgi:hypothetical protein